jgi:hypothetical protein
MAAFHVPVTPLLEVVGKASGVAFWQYGPSCVKVGTVGAVTTISIVAVVAHNPAVGVKVYVVVTAVAVDIAEFHVPVIPLVEVVGKASGVAFWHYGPSCVNVGTIGSLTVNKTEL